uniref:Thyroid receptor-interacting protein 11 n=2 Tax=Ciona intestinalis TaxID=7719 RepID=H2XUH1_CIOIN
MHSVQSANEGMVDKQLVKNLLVGYFGTTSHKQSDVMRLIVSVLGFSKEEENQINPRKSWGDWLSWKRTPPKVESADLNESFSQMFVKFLETESSSNHAELPASAMATEARLKLSQRKLAAQVPAVGDRSTVAGRYNPYTPSSPHQLMHPVAPTLPTFTPLTKSTEGNILQGILRTEPSS